MEISGLSDQKPRPKIAIIGSGISGISAAYFLSDKFSVKIFEKNNYLGGHANTVDVDYDGKKIAVDCGFIVFNHRTYPNLTPFFELLKVAYEKSNMSFAVKIDDKNLEYAGTNLGTIFAQLKNALNPHFLRMLFDIIRFNKEAKNILQQDFNPSYTLGDLLKDLKVRSYFQKYYLLPMSGAIWSCPLETMLAYPAQSFVTFFENHGLLNISNRPQWFTVSGGSREYVKKIAAKIGEENISLNNSVKSVERFADKVLVKSEEGEEFFDYVLFATHGNQVLEILKNPDSQEKAVFSNFKCQENLAVLHRDISLMPKAAKAWASWVYNKNGDKNKSDISVTYWMNNLQNIDKNYPLFVTLNPHQKIAEDKVFAKFDYQHPIFDSAAVNAQKQIEKLQGANRIFFCGAYQKYGFHEDGIASALKAINKLGVFAPWQ